MNAAFEKVMQERFGHDSLIALATVAEGIPYVRTVDAFYENGSFYVLTHALSNKMQQLAVQPLAGLSGEWFTGHGKCVNMGSYCSPENTALAAKVRKYFSTWIDNGHNDLANPDTVILRIDLTDAVLFANGTRLEL